FTDSLQLEETFKLGQYSISVKTDANQINYGWWGYSAVNGCTFLVEEYKKPEFDVQVEIEQSQYLNGDEIKATITADYFFGAPVTNATVEYKIIKEQFYVPWYYNYAYSWWYEEWYGGSYTSNKEILHTGVGKINSDGEFEIEYKTNKSDQHNYKYTIIAEVRDASRRTITGSSTAMVAYSEYNLSCNAGKYYYEPEEQVEINISASDLSKSPVKVPVKVYFYKNGKKDLIKVVDGITDEITGSVRTSAKLTKPGYYSVEVIGKDSNGKKVISNCSVYVLKENDYRYNWWGNNGGGIQIMTDKKVYMAGDKVRALVYIPENADALVTLNGNEQANYSVYSFRNLDSTGVVREIEFRINPDAFGKVEVSLGYMKNGSFYQKSEQFMVIPDNKYLNVEIEFSKSEYRPGTTANATVKITDDHGNPVPNANLTLSTADESIYFLYPDQSKDIKKAFYASNQINARFSIQGNVDHRMYSVMINPDEMHWRANKFNIDFERWNYLNKGDLHRIIYDSRNSNDLPSIQGYVVDFKTGKILPGAKVTCGNKSMLTDKNGYYFFNKLGRTYVTVTFENNGRFTTIQNVSTNLWSDVGLTAAISSTKDNVLELYKDPVIGDYKWAANKSESTINGLVTGNYTVTVTDANGATINNPIGTLNGRILSSLDNVSSFGTADGEAIVFLKGGTDPYTYGWDFGEGINMSIVGKIGTKGDFQQKSYEFQKKVVEAKIRSDFRDAIYWNPNLRTNKKGEAKIKIKLPDNLTTWRTSAKVITKDGKVGQTMAKITVKKDLLVRMETPRFMRVGDELLIATNIHNYLSTAKDVKVHLYSNGVAVFGTEQTIRVEANGEKRIDWKVEANWIRDAKVTVQALTDEESDAMEVHVPVLPHGLEMIEAESQSITNNGTKSWNMEIPKQIDLKTASMEINISPSITATLLSSFDDLIGYPYGCVEQTMSRFLPNVIVANTLDQIGNSASNIDEEELEKMVAKGVARLTELQHDDGGWGWWENDETHPFMTAYVVNGLNLAIKAGYQIDPSLYEKGLNALKNQILRKKGTATTKAYEQMVAARAGLELWSSAKRPKLNNMKNAYEISLWAQAAHYAGDRTNAKIYLNALIADATTESRLVFWGGKKLYYSWQEDHVETTANALKAILLIDPDHEIIPKAVQWLMNQRKGSSWHNTRQTAMTVFALQELIKQELNPDFELEVYANNMLVQTLTFTKEDILKKGKKLLLKGEDFTVSLNGVGGKDELLKKGINTIKVIQKGKGRSYISSRLKYYLSGTDEMTEAQKANQAFNVVRTYYKLQEKKTANGIVYIKTEANMDNILPGDNILVKVKVQAKSAKEFVLIEDPIPAGCEFIRDAQGFIIQGEANYGSGGNYWNNNHWGYWNWNRWYSHQEYRDSKLSMTITKLSKGDYEYTYLMKAQIPGTYQLTPAVAQLMYYPEVRGFSDFGTFKIQNDGE
ncbi:MAG: hypothetical protein JKY54_03365, partial [Flavobacteriales bacterium]|nr:hypothetical protein [Flavobacteriales bacterium]